MSRIGRMPIAVPAGVTVDIAENNKVTVKGPKGTLERVLPAEMDIKLDGDTITVSRPNDLKKMKSLHGLTRTLIHNMVVGVTEGYKKELEVNGVGYRAQKQGNKLVLALGYSHPVEMVDPDGIETSVDGNKIIVSGISKEKVGQYAAEIREKRAPEPYKGKGIKYVDETIRRKVGKTLVAASTTEKAIKDELEKTNDVDAAAYVGKVIAERALEKGIKTVIYDRGGFVYHGKVQALADAAREAGLEF